MQLMLLVTREHMYCARETRIQGSRIGDRVDPPANFKPEPGDVAVFAGNNDHHSGHVKSGMAQDGLRTLKIGWGSTHHMAQTLRRLPARSTAFTEDIKPENPALEVCHKRK